MRWGRKPVEIADLKKVRLEDGDTLVLRLAAPVTEEFRARLATDVLDHFGGKVRVFILDPGASLDVLEGPA